MKLCEQCGNIVPEGSGVDHELNETQAVVFCSMDHFKDWIDTHMGWWSERGRESDTGLNNGGYNDEQSITTSTTNQKNGSDNYVR